MTISPPNLIRLLVPPAVFIVLLVVLLALNGGDGRNQPSAADAGAPSGDDVADFGRAVRAAPGSAAAYAGFGRGVSLARA
jgi:hypothetical protein